MTDPDLVGRHVVIAAMRAIEEETIRRCAAMAREYAATKTGSRIAAAKANGAYDVASRIEKLPRKST